MRAVLLPRRWLKPLATLAMLAATAIPAAAAIPNTERLALLALYTSAGGANWTDKTGWGGGAGTECSWYGVTCSAGDANVIEIKLSGNRLNGSLPSNLKDLTQLNVFDVFSNNLTGTPPELPANLKELRVGANELSGPIPALPASLLVLSAGGNELSGSIPNPLPPG